MRVLVGSPVALEVVEREQPLGPGRQVAGLGLQRGEGARPTGGVVGGEPGEPEEPLHDAAGGRLPAFEEEGAVGDRVGVRPPDVGEDRRGRERHVAGGRAHDERQVAGVDGAEPDHSGVGVDAALRDQRGGREAGRIGDRGVERSHDRAHRQDATGPLGGQVLEAGLLHDLERPPAERAHVVPLGGRVVEAGRPLARQPVGQDVRRLDEPRRARVGVGLVLLEPERLGQHPLGRQDPAAVAEVGGAEPGQGGGGLVGPLVHPEERRPQRAPRVDRARRRCRRRNRRRGRGRRSAGRRPVVIVSRMTASVACHQASGSCSAHIGRGWDVA